MNTILIMISKILHAKSQNGWLLIYAFLPFADFDITKSQSLFHSKAQRKNKRREKIFQPEQLCGFLIFVTLREIFLIEGCTLN